MKVTFVLPGYARKPVGGIRVVYSYANGLAALGHEVTVVHVALLRRWPRIRDGRLRSQLKELLAGCRDVLWGAPDAVTWQHVDPAVDLQYAPVLASRSVPDGDAVVATAWQTADGVAALGAEKGRGAYLIQHHEIWSGRAARVDETWRLPLRKIVIARWLETRAHAMEIEDVCRVPNGLDTATFRVTQPIVGRHPRVAMLYSGWAWKGADDGIAALVIAKSSFPELEAVLFGTHPRPADLPGWIDYLRDPPQERLVRDVYNGSSIYCCPSHAEGWHLPPAEAMGCGCAVVSTDIDGVGDYAEDGRTALMSPARDAEALAANLLRLLRDDTMRVRLAMAGHENIQRFQWEQSTRELERALFADANVSAGT